MNSNNYNCLIKLAAPTQPSAAIPSLPPPPTPDDLMRIQAQKIKEFRPPLALDRRQPIPSVLQPSRNSFGDKLRNSWTTLRQYSPARRLAQAISGATTGAAGAMMQAPKRSIVPGSPEHQQAVMRAAMSGATTGAAGSAMLPADRVRHTGTPDFSSAGMEIKPGSPQHQALVGLLANKQITQEQLDQALSGGRITPGSPAHQALVSAQGMQQADTQPKTQPVVNPATGGTRLTYKGRPIIPDVSVPQTLPVTPYSSGRIAPSNMREAEVQARWNATHSELNNRRKQEVANNLDAMFAQLTRVNQARRRQGLPDYQPSVVDVYSPNFRNSDLDGADFENRLYNDIAMSAITQEAARRGTPYNDAEINMLQESTPPSGVAREAWRKATNNIWNQQFHLPELTPDQIGRVANGLIYR